MNETIIILMLASFIAGLLIGIRFVRPNIIS